MDVIRGIRPAAARTSRAAASSLRRLAAGLLLATGAGCAAAAAAAQPVRIAGVVYLGDLPTLVAEHEGLFARHGIEAQVAFNDSGRGNLRRLRAGEADFALMALTPVVLDRLADATPGGPGDPVILASLVHSTRLNDVVTLARHGVDSPAGLAGRRVGLARGTNAEFVWWLFAHFHGLDPAGSVVVDLPVAGIPAALETGEVDAAVVWEPWTTRLRLRHGAGLIRFPGANIYTAKWVLVARRGFAGENAEPVRAVLAAYRDAIEFIEDHPERALGHYAARAGLGDGLPRAARQALDYDLSLDWSLIATFREQLDWARWAGYPAADVEVEVFEAIQPGPLRAAFPGSVSLPAPDRGVEVPP